MQLVNEIAEIKMNKFFKVEITADLSLVKTELNRKTVFLVSARCDETAQGIAKRWYNELMGFEAPKNIGDLITITMDYSKYAMIGLMKNGGLLKEPKLGQKAVWIDQPIELDLDIAKELSRADFIYKNFTLSVFEELEETESA